MIFSCAVSFESKKKKIPDLSLPPCTYMQLHPISFKFPNIQMTKKFKFPAFFFQCVQYNMAPEGWWAWSLSVDEEGEEVDTQVPHVFTSVCTMYLKVDGFDPVSVDEECEEVHAQESNHEAQHQAPHQEPHLPQSLIL